MLTVIHNDALSALKTLEDESVQTCVTSPPYWGLRDYGLAATVWRGERECNLVEHCWDIKIPGSNRGGSGPPTDKNNRGESYGRNVGRGQFCLQCGAWRGCLGLEPTPELYVRHLVALFHEARRVLRSDGTLWLNLGDSYATGGGSVGRAPGGGDQGERFIRAGMINTQPNRMPIPGLKPKDLCMIPARVAMALQSDGWYLRSDIIWSKSNPMPESITDRPTKSHEYVFLMSKSERYFFDADAVREPHSGDSGWLKSHKVKTFGGSGNGELIQQHESLRMGEHPNGRNIRSVWTIPTAPFPEAHFATFPTDLVTPCVLAGTSARGACTSCGAPWMRNVERSPNYGRREPAHAPRSAPSKVDSSEWKPATVTDRGWLPGCKCEGDVTPCVVLDPFAGSGTTGKVAIELGRQAILIEPKAEYVTMIEKRCKTTIGLPLAI